MPSSYCRVHGKYDYSKGDMVYRNGCYTRVCPSCEDDAQDRALKRDERAKAALAKAAGSGLPELVGSLRQCGWAVEIRQSVINSLESRSMRDRRTEHFKEMVRIICDRHTDAKWWIENCRDPSFVGGIYSGIIRELGLPV